MMVKQSSQSALLWLLLSFGIIYSINDAVASDMKVDTASSKLSEKGHFQIEFTSRLDPIALNTMHEWVLEITSPEGKPVENASLSIGGGMPMHNHGLPTAPRVTQELKPGTYLLEGMKFQMGGHWTVTVDIQANDVTDIATFNLML